ncbi:MAG: LysM peptidoglycan-binding domain-containing M23 family metallopeptidase [Patescibacteria group bacterium]|nr:LysM peptidoglycan-binding domain-containing M23 family metallopeptidase [Patescibacteria group bacterium]
MVGFLALLLFFLTHVSVKTFGQKNKTNGVNQFMTLEQIFSTKPALALKPALSFPVSPEVSTLQAAASLAAATAEPNLALSLRRDELLKTVLAKKAFKYTVEPDETLSGIAAKFGLKIDDILAYNNIGDPALIKAGAVLNLPPDTKIQAIIPSSENYLVAPITGVFVKALEKIGGLLSPVSGLDEGLLHANNGVDISANCGQPVYAADDGLVIVSQDGWDGGYGNFIQIQHADGSITLYGHLSERVAQVDTYVKKGSLIGFVGDTGDSTGCHLHFEVRGKTNPFARQ